MAGYTYFLLIFHCNYQYISVLHRFRDITAYKVYVTACNSFNTTVEITGYMFF